MTRPQEPLSPLIGVALDDEAQRLDWAVARVWQVMGFVGVFGGLLVSVGVSVPLGLWVALMSAAYFSWFSLVLLLLRAGKGGRTLTILATVVEGTVPWFSFAILVQVQGAAYALGSWLPPMLFAALIVASVVRLRPLTPLVVGLSSALAFGALYFFWARGALPPELAGHPLFQTKIQVTRMFSFALSGVLGSLVCQGLLTVIGRAESSARAKDLFGKYRIVRQIASGGMGMVHEALYCPEGGFERPVAIKRIHPHLAEQDDLVESFRREAQLSARLVHPNIVQVFDFGRVSDTYFLAMEYVEGMTLLTFMKRHRAHKSALPAPVVAHIVRQVLHGLAFSHTDARGADGLPMRVIHRDMSPANVLLSRTGAVKISDFGLARALRDAVSTKTLTVAGHVGYMAPEQARGESLDARCDLFGLGVIVWEMLAGARLFLRDTQATTLLALIADPVVPITSLREDLADGWNSFIDSALARVPSGRFASARAMLTALNSLCPPQPTDIDLLRAALGSAELAPAAPTADPESVTMVDAGPPRSARPGQSESQPP